MTDAEEDDDGLTDEERERMARDEAHHVQMVGTPDWRTWPDGEDEDE